MNPYCLSRISSTCLILGLLLTLAASSVVQAGQPITPVAIKDQLPPAIGPNTGFATFGNIPALNDAGQVAFKATFNGVGVNSTNDTAIFSGPPGSLQLVARKGSPAPGPGGKIYTGEFDLPDLNESGTTLFGDNRDNGFDTNVFALYVGPPGAITLLAKQGDLVPGSANPINKVISVGGPYDVQINEAGQAVFGVLFAGDQQFSLVVGAPGSLTIAARPGMQAPGLPSGVKFDILRLETASITLGGRILFQANVNSATESYGDGLFIGPPGNLALFARTGDQAAGTAPGVFYDMRQVSSSLSASGSVAFGTLLSGLGVRRPMSTDCGLARQEHFS